ncbi:MAG: hypothetical protein NW224_00365 [Leptolyngbyaceae cyanobacterium bins.302]|nr:hypothetical protein [Leptolyngbyaceae cyanobacterium bins.302]
MQQISLKDVLNGHDESLRQAIAEPILLMDDAHPNLVVMSAEHYWQLTNRLAALEDEVFGQLAQANLKTSKMVGENFVKELQQLAAQDGELA